MFFRFFAVWVFHFDAACDGHQRHSAEVIRDDRNHSRSGRRTHQTTRPRTDRTLATDSHGVKLVARPRVFDQQRCDFADPRTRRAPSSSAARQAFKNVELAGHDVHHPLSKNGWRWLHRTRPLFSTIFTSFISPPQDLDGVGWMAWAIQPENNE